MSPRSEEYAQAARERLDDAEYTLSSDRRRTTIDAAYYAALTAARAALSEHDESPRTHAGVWARTHDLLVRTGRVDPAVHAAAAALQRTREESDYDLVAISAEEAKAAVDAARAYVDAVLSVIDA